MSKQKEYKDEYFCEHCGKDTMHLVKSYEHERDSSGDLFECLVCHYWRGGLTDEQNPPHNEE